MAVTDAETGNHYSWVRPEFSAMAARVISEHALLSASQRGDPCFHVGDYENAVVEYTIAYVREESDDINFMAQVMEGMNGGSNQGKDSGVVGLFISGIFRASDGTGQKDDRSRDSVRMRSAVGRILKNIPGYQGFNTAGITEEQVRQVLSGDLNALRAYYAEKRGRPDSARELYAEAERAGISEYIQNWLKKGDFNLLPEPAR